MFSLVSLEHRGIWTQNSPLKNLSWTSKAEYIHWGEVHAVSECTHQEGKRKCEEKEGEEQDKGMLKTTINLATSFSEVLIITVNYKEAQIESFLMGTDFFKIIF